MKTSTRSVHHYGEHPNATHSLVYLIPIQPDFQTSVYEYSLKSVNTILSRTSRIIDRRHYISVNKLSLYGGALVNLPIHLDFHIQLPLNKLGIL